MKDAAVTFGDIFLERCQERNLSKSRPIDLHDLRLREPCRGSEMSDQIIYLNISA